MPEPESQADENEAERIERLARAQALTLALLDCTTPKACAAAVLNEGVAAFGAAAGSVCLIDERAGRLVLTGAVGYPPEMLRRWGRRWRLDDPTPLCDGARTGRALYLRTAEEYRRLYPHLQAEPLTTSRSWIVLPLLVHGRPIGVLGLSYDEPQAFDAADRGYLEGLALLCAVAIERTRLAAEAAGAAGAADDAATTAEKQRQLLKAMLASVTDGGFLLCEGEWELPRELPPAPGPSVGPLALERPQDVRSLRLLTRLAAQAVGFPQRRVEEIETAVGECAMNALLHGGGGEGRVRGDREAGVVQVWIQDRGVGIPLDSLTRATLQKGFTTGGSFGHGFKFVLAFVERLYLLTGSGGTTVVLEHDRALPPPAWLVDNP